MDAGSVPFLWVVQFCFIPVIGALFFLVNKNKGQADTEIASAKKLADDHRRAVDMVQLKHMQDLQTFQLQVTKDYAPNSYLRDVETRLVTEIRRVADKLDAITDRMADNGTR